MFRTFIFVVVLLFALIVSGKCFSQDEFSILKGHYMGQKLPGITAEPFTPGIERSSPNNNPKLMNACLI